MKVQKEYKGLVIELETLDGRLVTGRVFEKIPGASDRSPWLPTSSGYLFTTDTMTVGKSIGDQLDTVIASCVAFVDLLVLFPDAAKQALNRKFSDPPFGQ